MAGSAQTIRGGRGGGGLPRPLSSGEPLAAAPHHLLARPGGDAGSRRSVPAGPVGADDRGRAGRGRRSPDPYLLASYSRPPRIISWSARVETTDRVAAWSGERAPSPLAPLARHRPDAERAK